MRMSVAPRRCHRRANLEKTGPFEKNTAQDADTRESMMPEPCRTMTPSPISNHHAAAARGMRFTTVAACLMLALSGCASVAPQRAAPVAVDVPADWSAADVSATTGAPSLAQWWLRFDDPLLGQPRGPGLAGQHQRQECRRPRCGRRGRCAMSRRPRCCRRSAVRPRHSAASAAATVTGNSFKVGLDASWELDIFGANRSALDASEATAQASAASLGDVQVSIAAEVALELHHAARRPGAAGDRRRQPGQPARDPADHAVAPAGRPGHLARSRAGARRGRADTRPVAGVADQHRADPSCARGADRPAAGGLVDACWPRPARCRRRPTTWR